MQQECAAFPSTMSMKLSQQRAAVRSFEKKSTARRQLQQQQSISRGPRAFDHDSLWRSKYFARAPSVISTWREPRAAQQEYTASPYDVREIVATACETGLLWQKKKIRTLSVMNRPPHTAAVHLSRGLRAFDHDALWRSKSFARAPSVVSRW